MGNNQGDSTIGGVPISPLLANLYLHKFDQFMMTREGLHYVRYADNCLVGLINEKDLPALKEEVAKYLATNLRLQIHGTKLPRVTFLGCVLSIESERVRIRAPLQKLKKKSKGGASIQKQGLYGYYTKCVNSRKAEHLLIRQR